MRMVGESGSVGRYEVDGYETVSVDIERRAGYGETGCDKAISVDGGVLCLVNEGLEGMKKMWM